MFGPFTSAARKVETFPEAHKPSNKPRGTIAMRSYSVVYDDDLDSWSVVSTPFDGLYFVGTKAECEAFVTTMGISGLRLLQRN